MKKFDQKTNKENPLNKRQEIINIAYKIFYKEGFHATGVDKILLDSGISKRTLYKYFSSKEELIKALVEHYQDLLLSNIPKIIEKRSKNPKEQILLLFDVKGEEFKKGDFRGCFAINAKLEFEGKNHAIEDTCRAFYLLLEAYIEKLCKKAKLKNPEKLARKIIIIFEGAIILGQMHHDPSTMKTAKEIAKTLIAKE